MTWEHCTNVILAGEACPSCGAEDDVLSVQLGSPLVVRIPGKTAKLATPAEAQGTYYLSVQCLDARGVAPAPALACSVGEPLGWSGQTDAEGYVLVEEVPLGDHLLELGGGAVIVPAVAAPERVCRIRLPFREPTSATPAWSVAPAEEEPADEETELEEEHEHVCGGSDEDDDAEGERMTPREGGQLGWDEDEEDDDETEDDETEDDETEDDEAEEDEA